MWYVLGIGAIIVIMHIRAKVLWKLTPIIYGAGLFVMAILLKFYDRSIAAVTGSKNWFAFGSFTLQPAELMKIALYFDAGFGRDAAWSSSQAYVRVRWLVNCENVSCHAACFSTYLLLQKDFGTMLVFLAILSRSF